MVRLNSTLPPLGRLTTGLFRMKKHYARVRELGTPGWLLIYTLEGLGRFGHAGGELIVRRGDLVMLKPRVRHDYGLERSLRRWDLLWAYFFPRAEWLPLLNWPEEAEGLMRLRPGKAKGRLEIVRELMEAHRLNAGPERLREMKATNALERALLICDGINPQSEEGRIDARVRGAMDYLCENLGRAVTAEQLARNSGLSVSRLAHLFREQVGLTPHQFLETQRMSRARQLLALTQQPVGEVAAEVGFADLFHFSKRFKARVGASPRNYREEALRQEG